MSDLRAHTRAAAGAWRNVAADLAVLRDRDPEDLAWRLVATAAHDACHWQTELERLLAHPRPTDEMWAGEWYVAASQFALWHVALAAARHAVDLAAVRGVPAAAMIVERMTEVVLEAQPVSAALTATTAPLDATREAGSAAFAGWVRTQLSLGWPRLRGGAARLADGAATIEDALLDALPAEALVAWADRTAEDEPLSQVRNRVARAIESHRQRDERLADVADAGDRAGFAASENEHADFRELLERAGLTPREHDVFAAWIVDGRTTAPEIAAHLGVAAATVRVLQGRIRTKLLKKVA